MSQSTTTAISRATQRSQWARLGVSIAIALVANLVIYVVGNALIDGSIQVANPSTGLSEDLPISALVAASVIAVTLGVAFLAVAERFWKVTPALVVVAIVTLLSLGAVFALDVEASSKLTLTIMHLATGATVIAMTTWASE